MAAAAAAAAAMCMCARAIGPPYCYHTSPEAPLEALLGCVAAATARVTRAFACLGSATVLGSSRVRRMIAPEVSYCSK
eukprot:COSAG01_NODE_8592_length_2725_cov_20.421173_2_plen_78_part_00